jgi:hypothetical protein
MPSTSSRSRSSEARRRQGACTSGSRASSTSRLRERIGILPAENHRQSSWPPLRDDLSGMLRALTADALRAGDVAS